MLAGGKSRRFGGTNKSLIEIEGVTIAERSVTLLKPLFHEIILAGWPPGSRLPAGVRPVGDNYEGLGPLAGIEAALRVSATPVAFIFGGDMPWLSEEIITGQARDFLSDPTDILVPRLGDLPEPLHSVWSCSLHEQVKRYLESGGSPAIIDFFRLVRTRFLMLERTPETLKAFTNINNPGDIPKAS